MKIKNTANIFSKLGSTFLSLLYNKSLIKCHHDTPFIKFYENVTGQIMSSDVLCILKKRHPNLENISQTQIDYTLQILNKFGITEQDACENPHVFFMNSISMDNYGEILKECNFVNIIPKYIIRYHTIVRSRTIDNLKKEGLLKHDLNLEEHLLCSFKDWPDNEKHLNNFSDSNTSILTVRTSVLEKYLTWRLSVTEEEFKNYCKNYLPLRHRPMCDIKEALDIAQNEIKFNLATIKRNGFIISSDPLNTKLIIENVNSLAGYDIREAIKNEPAILKNNYYSLIQIKNILQENGISEEAQRHCLRVYCMQPQTVQERLDELKELKEFQILSTNPRVLSMVVHKRKMISRLQKIQSAKKQCYSLNQLVSSRIVFNNYINNFGNKVCGRDMAILITSSIKTREACKRSNGNDVASLNKKRNGQSDMVKNVLNHLRKHKYWLHSSLYVINENIKYLNEKFYGDVIVNNCQILLYPLDETKHYLEYFLKKRIGDSKANNMDIPFDGRYNYLNYPNLTDNQILSLVLYEIERKYYFSGDGIWSKQNAAK